MTIIDDSTVVVYDTDDLRDAVSSDNGINYVYFGADITLAYGVTIYPGKPSLTFDGTHEGVRYTFTDMNSSVTADTIGIRAVSDIVITFKNINLIGRNYYGIPYVPNGSVYSGISTLYEDVTYTGTQINHNPYGFTRFTDCNIAIDNNEAAEVSRLEIGGETTIQKTNDMHSVFWLYGTGSQRPYLRILAGANVTITTTNYLIYENNPPDLIIEPGASFTVNTNNGICYNVAHTVRSLLVDENASVRFIQSVNTGRASLFIDGPFTVNEGANFYMQADYANSSHLIRFTGSSCGLYINNPKSFVVYNRESTSAKAFSFAATIPFTISGGQLNFWEEATQFPDAGTFDDRPMHKWNRPDYTCFTLTGTANNTTTVVTSHDFTDEELADLPLLTDLQLHRASVLSCGNIPLTVYSTVLTRSVTGLTDPYANIMITLLPSYFDDPNTVVADSDGIFSLVPSSPLPFSDQVNVYSNIPFLIVSVLKAVMSAEELYIESAPISISFPYTPLSEYEEIILPRDLENTLSSVVIVDTRAGHPTWQLWVSIDRPLMTDDNDVLTDGVVFGIENGGLETVQADFKAIHTGQHQLPDDLTLTWDIDKGVLARISVPIRSGKKYTTLLNWAVTPEGQRPEDM